MPRIGAQALTSANIIAALGYTPVNRAGDTMTGALLGTSTNLGSGANPFGDVFLKSTGKLDFGNGNYTATHSSGALTVSGTFNVAANGATLTVGDGSNAVVSIPVSGARAWFGYDGTNAVLQGASGKGVELNVNNGAFGSGTILGISSAGLISITDASNLALGTTTGTKIGTATTQKIGFYNATPIVQPAGVAVTAEGIHAALVSLGLIAA